MSSPQTTHDTDPPVDASASAPGSTEPTWWHRSHPTFAAITGFFSGMLFVTAVPGAFAGLLRLMFSFDTAERLFPLVLVGLVVLLQDVTTLRVDAGVVAPLVLVAVGAAGLLATLRRSRSDTPTTGPTTDPT